MYTEKPNPSVIDSSPWKLLHLTVDLLNSVSGGFKLLVIYIMWRIIDSSPWKLLHLTVDLLNSVSGGFKLLVIYIMWRILMSTGYNV